VRRRLSRPLKRKHKALVKKLKKAKKEAGVLEKPAIIKTHLRDLVITPELIGSIVAIYNGKVRSRSAVHSVPPSVVFIAWVVGVGGVD
jgi:ribosomal protein uS19